MLAQVTYVYIYVYIALSVLFGNTLARLLVETNLINIINAGASKILGSNSIRGLQV